MTARTDKKPAAKRTAPRDVRRKQLIMAAIDSIAKRGFSDTTLRHVTEKAKLSHGVVNYHFASKEALYDATLGYLAQEHYEVWTQYLAQAPDSPAHQLEAIVRADFDARICTHRRLAVWFAFWGQAKYRPNYLKIHNKFDDERYEKIRELCGLIVRNGDYESMDPERAARQIEALSDGAWLSLMLYPKITKRTDYLRDNLDALTRIFPRDFPTTPDTTRQA